jgi:hypothetical protein
MAVVSRCALQGHSLFDWLIFFVLGVGAVMLGWLGVGGLIEGIYLGVKRSVGISSQQPILNETPEERGNRIGETIAIATLIIIVAVIAITFAIGLVVAWINGEL